MADALSAVGASQLKQNAKNLMNAGNVQMGKYEFLQLLVTQLKNQDPLSPMQSQEFASQLAQFSSLERLMNIDDSLKDGVNTDMLLAQTIQNTMATNFVGKEVLSYGDNIPLMTGDNKVPLSFELAGDAEKVSVEIYDENDNLVRTIKMSSLDKGRNSVDWDGKDDAGKELPGGNYHFKIVAEDGDGNKVIAKTLSRGIVSAVRYEKGQPVLVVNGKDVYFGDIVQIG